MKKTINLLRNVMITMFSKQTILLMLGILLGTFLVLYLSWTSSPKIGGLKFIPSWISTWVDSYTFMTIRTAIPLMGLGVFTGLFLNYQKRRKTWWLISWILITILVLLAELGQLYRPLRSFDWLDVIWGVLGSGLGLSLIYILSFIKAKYFIKNRPSLNSYKNFKY